MKKAPALPFFISVADYHEFTNVQSAMSLINPKIKIEEVSTDLERFTNESVSYVGIVYEGRRPSDKVIVDILSNKKTKIYPV